SPSLSEQPLRARDNGGMDPFRERTLVLSDGKEFVNGQTLPLIAGAGPVGLGAALYLAQAALPRASLMLLKNRRRSREHWPLIRERWRSLNQLVSLRRCWRWACPSAVFVSRNVASRRGSFYSKARCITSIHSFWDCRRQQPNDCSPWLSKMQAAKSSAGSNESG